MSESTFWKMPVLLVLVLRAVFRLDIDIELPTISAVP